jgi:hypothetical protein
MMKTEIKENCTLPAWEIVDEYSYVESPLPALEILNVNTGDNESLKIVKERVEKDTEILTLWNCSNVIAVNRLGYSDHGFKHIEIVSKFSLRLLKMLDISGVMPSCMRDYGLSYNDAEIIVFLGACLHDIGHSIHRDDHTNYSVWLAGPIIKRLLNGLYGQEELTIMTSEILHCIAVHHRDCKPLTIEAGVLRACDALDMAHGRTRLWDDAKKNSIHAVSARVIDSVELFPGNTRPILIKVKMSGTAGIFQVDKLLKPKLENSGIEKYVEIEAEVTGEKRMVTGFTIS